MTLSGMIRFAAAIPAAITHGSGAVSHMIYARAAAHFSLQMLAVLKSAFVWFV